MPCKLFFKKSNIGYINIRLNRFKSKKKKSDQRGTLYNNESIQPQKVIAILNVYAPNNSSKNVKQN